MGWWSTGNDDDVSGDAPLDILDDAHEALGARPLAALLRLWQDALNAVASEHLADPGSAPFTLRAWLAAPDPEDTAQCVDPMPEPADAAARGLAERALYGVALAYGDAAERAPRSSEVGSTLRTSLAAAIRAGRVTDTQRRLQRLDVTPNSSAAAQSLLTIELLRRQLAPLLQTLAQDRDGRLAATLRPRAGDAAHAFRPADAAAAEAAYDTLWQHAPPRVAPVPHDHALQVELAPAGMFADANALSQRFPAGYRGIAERLAPQRVWVRWKYTAPGAGAGVSYDGLVWLDDHWAWYPKPYRVLAG